MRQQGADGSGSQVPYEALLRFRNILCNLKSVIVYHAKLPGKIVPTDKRLASSDSLLAGIILLNPCDFLESRGPTKSAQCDE